VRKEVQRGDKWEGDMYVRETKWGTSSKRNCMRQLSCGEKDSGALKIRELARELHKNTSSGCWRVVKTIAWEKGVV
jgi:hypothetical protein